MRHWTTAESESDLIAQILLAHSNGAARLFRINAGLAWQGQILEQTARRLVLMNPRAIRLAAPGFSDIVGWGPDARFTAIETKFGRRQATDEQRAFLELVIRSGGRAGIARTVDDSAEILGV